MRSGSRLCALLLCAAAVGPAHATAADSKPIIDPLSWRELLNGPSFVGVVECETAGDLEARFKVVESWKGAPAGTHLRLRLATNNVGPRAPTVLVGERALVTSFAVSPSRVIGSGSSGERVPLWFRKNRADGVLPLLQGWVSLPLSANADLLGSGDKTLEQLHARAAAFLALSETEQEVQILADSMGGLLLPAVARSRTAEDSVAALISYLQGHPAQSSLVAQILGHGGPATLASLQKLPPDQRDRVAEASDEIQERLPVAQRPSVPQAAPAPTPRMMEKMRDALAAEDARTWNGAISVLTVYDCDAVVTSLVAWQPPARLPDYGFALGSWVAWRCGTNRKANLARLADSAADGWLRAWGATYLAIEDAPLGLTSLQKVAQLPATAGDWAALELARRGDKSGMARVLALLGMPRDPAAPLFVVQMRSRAAALLSNSASNGKVGLPPLSPVQTTDNVECDAAALQRWWTQVGPTIQLQDPWLPELVAEQVD